MAALFVDAVFPGKCLACGKLFTITRDRAVTGQDPAVPAGFARLLGRHLCGGCRGRYTGIESPLCLSCGVPFASPHGPDHLCGDCLRSRPGFVEARAAGVYQSVLKSTIHHFKYKRQVALAKPLGRLLWDACRRWWDPGGFDYIVPVPLHASRLRERGFNQAHQLVRGWPRLATAGRIDLPPDKIVPDLLRRDRVTPAQTGLKREQRIANLRHAFSFSGTREIGGKRVLIVDDVLTTGATADICAHTLTNAGAGEVKVLTLARTIAGGGHGEAFTGNHITG